MNAIETQDLKYTAGRGARAFKLAGLNMRVPTGSIYGFLGANGAGKTTTMRLILGLIQAESGQVTIFGESMPKNYEPVLRRTGYVPERPHIYPYLTVAQAIEFHRAFYPTWDQHWADSLLSQFDLVPDRKQSALSKGQAGKLQILIALAQRPELLVLDEPTDGLDPVVRRDILDAVLAYVADTRATVLISSHLVHELERICDWIGLLDNGQLLAELPMQEFKNGMKRIRLSSAPATLTDAPFTILARDASRPEYEQWLVRGWAPGMETYLDSTGATVREVIDLDLESGFVELLRAARRR